MELEEMKTLWGEMSIEIEKQKKLTDSLIIKMTQADYRNKISKILIPESIGAIICFAEHSIYTCQLSKTKQTWYLLSLWYCFYFNFVFLLLSCVYQCNL